MTHLNLQKRIEEGYRAINFRYDIDHQTMRALLEMSKNNCDLIGNSFVLGYAQGVRAAKAESKRGIV